MKNSLFPDLEILPENLFLDLKYDGDSFKGVMEIRSLGQELLSLEYCLQSIIKKLKKKKAFKGLKESDFEIVVEGLINNCFRKKIVFYLDEIENRPQLVSLIKWAVGSLGGVIFTVSGVPQDLISKIDSKNIPTEIIQEIKDDVTRDLITNAEFRKNLSQIVGIPLKKENDTLNISSPMFAEEQQNLFINKDNKKNFLEIAGSSEKKVEKIEKKVYDKISGRINAIDLDATKNKVGFKVDNEGNEIKCSLREGLEVDDLKDYLGSWVEIDGWITYNEELVNTIEIHELKEIKLPKQVSLIDELNQNN